MGSLSNRPIILVVTGAWHPPPCYKPLDEALAGLGYECVIPHLPSMGHDANGVTWKADRDLIVKMATPYFEAGRDVVLVAHSYGGVPAGAATNGQGFQERRKRGQKGGFKAIIFLAAFAIPVSGTDLLTTFGGSWPDWQDTHEPYTKNKLSRVNDSALAKMYSDATKEEQRRAFAMTLPHSQDAFETPVDFIATDIAISKTYLVCEDDQVFPPALQRHLARSTPGMKEASISAGHSPFLGKCRETAKVLVEIVERST